MTSPVVPVPQVPVSQVALNVWRAATDRTRADASVVRSLLAQDRDSDADIMLDEIIDQAAVLGLSMEQAGAQHPCPLMHAEPARRLALLLRAAYSAAVEADGERADAGKGGERLADALEPLLEAAERAAGKWEGPEDGPPE